MNEDLDSFKSKRLQHSIGIRRENRQQLLNKRRNLVPVASSQCSSASQERQKKTGIIIFDPHLSSQIEKFHCQNYSEDNIDKYVAMLASNQLIQRIYAVIGLRTISDSDLDNGAIVNKLVSKRVVELLIKAMLLNDSVQIKYEGLSLISNMTCVDGICKVLMDNQIVSLILQYLGVYQTQIDQHILAILGNLCLDNIKYRDIILQAGGFEQIYKLYQTCTNKDTFQNLIWALCNLGRGTPGPKSYLIDNLIPILCDALKKEFFADLNNQSVNKSVSDILWLLSHFSENDKARVDRLAQCDILPLLYAYASQVIIPALKILGNFTNLSVTQTQYLLDNDILSLCYKLLGHKKSKIRKQVVWMLSNIAAGSPPQVQQFLSRMDILDKLNQMFREDSREVTIQICWVYSNLTYFGNKSEIFKILQHYQTVGAYVQLMEPKGETEFLENLIKTLTRVITLGNSVLQDKRNLLLDQFCESGGIAKIQSLQDHPSVKVYNGAVAFLKKFFELN